MRYATIPITLACLALLGCGDDTVGSNDNNENGNNQQIDCGNGDLDGLEECDDGAANSDTLPDACRTDCTQARCGDGVTDAGELCDEGAANNDDVPDACRTTCEPAFCGDDVVDVASGETCDEGAALPTATCGSNCRVLYCGNGY